MRAAVLSNTNVESLSRRVGEGRHEVWIAEGYGAWIQELGSAQAALWKFEPDAVFLLLDGAELLRGCENAPAKEMALALDEQFVWIERAAERATAVKFFVSTIDVPGRPTRSLKHRAPERFAEHRWLERTVALSERCANVYVLDVKGWIEDKGRSAFCSAKRWYFGGMRYSVVGEKTLAREMTRVLDAQVQARKKVLVVDLDNTLWGGVVGEEGVSGIEIAKAGAGARFHDLQCGVRDLKDLGIVLAIASKNNESDVAEVFERRRDMPLSLSDFASKKISWSPKVESLAEIARDLDVGTDTLVFLDDNPVEREAVRTALPEIVVPEFPPDTSDLPELIGRIYGEHFFAIESTEEDRKRAVAYAENGRRAEARTVAASFEEFLVGLQTKIVLSPVHAEDVARAAQLSQKTNQLNMTTRRYSEADVQRFTRSPEYMVRIGSVVDQFGDSGKVFLSIVHRRERDSAELDTFLMSCRVMGRFLEDQIFGELGEQLRVAGVRRLIAHFVPTTKNAPARAFFDRLVGEPSTVDAEGRCTRTFDLCATPLVSKPAYAELVVRRD